MRRIGDNQDPVGTDLRQKKMKDLSSGQTEMINTISAQS